MSVVCECKCECECECEYTTIHLSRQLISINTLWLGIPGWNSRLDLTLSRLNIQKHETWQQHVAWPISWVVCDDLVWTTRLVFSGHTQRDVRHVHQMPVKCMFSLMTNMMEFAFLSVLELVTVYWQPLAPTILTFLIQYKLKGSTSAAGVQECGRMPWPATRKFKGLSYICQHNRADHQNKHKTQRHGGKLVIPERCLNACPSHVGCRDF